MEVSFPRDVVIAANAADLDLLRAAPRFAQLGGVRLLPLASDAEVPAETMKSAGILVLEVDPLDRKSLRRIAQVRAARADLPIVVAVRDASITLVRTLVREGVSDVATLPFNADDLISQVLDAAALRDGSASDAALSPLISVVRSAGGCGTTSVITELAAAIARDNPGDKGVCVIDLDLQGGSVGAYLGVNARITVAEVLDAGERLDVDFLRNATSESGRGFSLVVAPETITSLEAVDIDQVLKLLTLARQEFDYVLVDLPASWMNWSLSVAVAATELVMITDQSIAGLRQARRRLDLLTSLGVKRERIRLVVNRVERKMFKTIGMEDVSAALDCDVFATISAEGAALSSAQDQGMLLSEITHKSRFSTDIRALAGLLAPAGGQAGR